MNTAVQAQQIQLVKDINTTPGSYSPNLRNNIVVNGKIFFLSYQPGSDIQLFVTDGTEAGTVRLTDNDSGADQPYGLTSANGYVFYKARFERSWWLFRSDGTKDGTIPIHKLAQTYENSNDIEEVNGTVYFSGSQDYSRNQLWKTDGTIAGTTLVRDMGSTENGYGIYDFYNFKGKLHFINTLESNGEYIATIWSSDGTAAGTKAGASYTGTSFKPAVAGNYMYFSPTYYSQTNVLYKTDGKSITALTNGQTEIRDPFAIGTKVYFATNDALWITDGTVAGTMLLKNIHVNDGRDDPQRAGFTNLNGTLFFSASTGIQSEIWKSDGTAAGTVQVTNLNATSRVDQIESIIVAGNHLVFGSSDPGGKLWKSDGTATGTVVLADFPGFNPVLLGSNVIFNGTPATGNGLFRTDLTSAAPQRITKVTTEQSLPYNFTDVNGTLYFTAKSSSDSFGLWKSDGTQTGTVQVQKLNYVSYQITTANGIVYYTEKDYLGVDRIWRTNGTTGDAVLVADLSDPKFGVKQISSLTAIGNTLYFILFDSSGRMELWKSGGTPVVTSFIRAFESTSRPDFEPIAFKGQLYFGIVDQTSHTQIWKTNGTGAGTQLAPEFASSGRLVTNDGRFDTFSVIGDNLYGLFYNNSSYKLIKTDGTPTAATTVASLPFIPASLFGAGGLIYISSVASDAGKKSLWRTDGTVSGTFELAVLDVNLYADPELGPNDPFRLQTDVNGKLFFMNTEPALGDHLWVSDGTVAGTRRLTQVPQNRISFFTQHTESLNGVLYFDYYEPATGREIWRSDGTPEGTHVLEDFTPNGNTAVGSMKTVNNTLLITADTGEYGGELYKIVPAAGQPSLRINAGGTTFTASGDRMFSADQFYNGTTQISNAADGDIAGTTDDQLYKEQRFGSSFSYNIPVTNGTYNVVLHFAEIYWGVPSRSGTTGPNKRRFHVDMEGTRKLTDYDIFVKAGGVMRAKTETFTVIVTDNTLNIDFLKGAADKPIIAAIEVLPTQVILNPLADAYIRNTPNEETNYGTERTLEVKTGSLPSYQRGTYLKFPLTGVSNVGSAKLRLYGSNEQTSANTSAAVYGVSDDTWTETGIKWSNAPVASAAALGSVNVHSTVRYYEIDVTAFVRSELAGDKTISLFVTNPAGQNARLVFNSRENAAYPPQLVIEKAVSPAARTSAEEIITRTEKEAETSGIYPNPAGKSFTVHIAKAHQGKVDLQLISLSGTTYQISHQKKAASASKVEMDVSSMQLPQGIYILKIQSAALVETVRILLTE
ncbi:malectin domain-containing carbohydrate-binding protein [Dyadobacter sp. NIV53]|uniref:CBM96 family carbohydrate-binding protein n=1 Tax=Dyadobacter sp. NIV53 TaxID=2861765 RepID=UPI001C87E647|nr:malectin domain-containing carbohydrate-binding protein [Dyadobacter sp. NIV53]